MRERELDRDETGRSLDADLLLSISLLPSALLLSRRRRPPAKMAGMGGGGVREPSWKDEGGGATVRGAPADSGEDMDACDGERYGATTKACEENGLFG